MSKIEELKQKIDSVKKRLEENQGHFVVGSENGPIGMITIDAIVDVLEDLQNQIDHITKTTCG